MINRKILFPAVAAMLAIISACSNDSGTGIENRDPILVINNETLMLTGSPRYDVIEISNGGGGQLKWNAVEWPDWMELSTFAGRVDRDTLDLKLTTNFSKLQYGSYEGNIVITSNGGDVTISVKLDYRPPELKIEAPVINLDRHYRYSELEIKNIGGGELVWQIAQSPEWLKFEEIEGTVYSRPEKIPFRARLSELPYGNYEDKVEIMSNGGKHEIMVFLTYEREVEVYPGIGAANIDLEDTYTMVQSRLGKPDRNWYDRPEKTVFIHHFTYDELGMHFAVKNNSMILYGSGKVGYIEVFAPYDGMTQELIGIGNTSSELIKAVGQPSQKNGNEWFYQSGITYVLENNRISKIIIKSSDF